MSAQGALRDGIASGLGLIETLRWEPAGGFLRLDRHMARLEGSAGALGLPFPRTKIDRSLATVGGDRPLRVRLVLGAGGAVGLTTHPFAPLDGDMVWMLAIASTRLSSADPLLRHKTTRREAYARARAEFPATTVEEVLLLNERGEVCEGTITTLFVDRGAGAPLATPPLSSGLLAGVLRQSLLDTGQAVESVLEPRDLREAHALFVGNSLRGLIPARLDAAI